MKNGSVILVPVKNRENAKQRLQAVLTPAQRLALAEAMLKDVLSALAAWKERPPVAVVGSDPYTGRLASRFSFEFLPEPDNRGESEAIARASKVCETRGKATLVVPGDVPLVRAEELRQILDAAPAEGAVLVPSLDGRGSNAVWRRPAALFALTFGGESFPRHLDRARATGKPWVTLSLPGVALDVDTPEDLARLLAAEGDTRAQRLARGWGLEEQLLALAKR